MAAQHPGESRDYDLDQKQWPGSPVLYCVLMSSTPCLNFASALRSLRSRLRIFLLSSGVDSASNCDRAAAGRSHAAEHQHRQPSHQLGHGSGKTMNTRHQSSLTRQLHNHGRDEKMEELSEIADTGVILFVNLQGKG